MDTFKKKGLKYYWLEYKSGRYRFVSNLNGMTGEWLDKMEDATEDGENHKLLIQSMQPIPPLYSVDSETGNVKQINEGGKLWPKQH